MDLNNLDLGNIDFQEVDYDLSLKAFVKRAWRELEPGTPMVDGWVMDAICAHLEAVSRGEITRLIINVPPGFSKSMLTNVFWPAWEWRNRAWLRFISGSYAQELAVRDLVRARDLVTSEWYSSRWPITFHEATNLKTVYANTETGFRFATSVGGSLTGYRGDRIILDDPHSVKTAESEAHRLESLRWMTETVPTRLNESKRVPSAIVVIMQRLHEEDISGLLLDTDDSWTHLCLPMEWEGEEMSRTDVLWTSEHLGITEPEPFKDPRGHCPSRIPSVEGQTRDDVEELLFPERFDRQSVDRLKAAFRAMGEDYAIAGQLQQRPAPRGGGMFRLDDFVMVNEAPKGGIVCRGWDLAATSKKKNKRAAYTAGCLVKVVDGKIYICDMQRGQWGPSEVESSIQGTAAYDGMACPISIPQDPGAAGIHTKRAMAALLHGYDVHFSPESGDKELRANPIAAQVRAGNVHVVKGPWNKAFFNEAANFPAGTYKDQIDAMTRAYAYLVNVAEPEVEIFGGDLIT